MEKTVILASILIIIGLFYVVDSSLFNNVIMDDTEIPGLLKRSRIETVKHLGFFALFLIIIYAGTRLFISGKEGDDN